MTLSRWLRDYLYIPLGGNRKGRVLTYRNLLLTMLLGGLWHGAAWTFVIWGGLHGVRARGRARRAIASPAAGASGAEVSASRWLGRLVTFHFVCFAWIFFRASSLSAAALQVIGRLFTAWGQPSPLVTTGVVLAIAVGLAANICRGAPLPSPSTALRGCPSPRRRRASPSG